MNKRALLNLADILAALADDVLSVALGMIESVRNRVVALRVKVKEKQTEK